MDSRINNQEGVQQFSSREELMGVIEEQPEIRKTDGISRKRINDTANFGIATKRVKGSGMTEVVSGSDNSDDVDMSPKHLALDYYKEVVVNITHLCMGIEDVPITWSLNRLTSFLNFSIRQVTPEGRGLIFETGDQPNPRTRSDFLVLLDQKIMDCKQHAANSELLKRELDSIAAGIRDWVHHPKLLWKPEK